MDAPQPAARAVGALADGRLDEAEKWIQAVLSESPDDVDVLVVLGQIYAEQERLRQAAVVYTRLARLRPRNGQYALRAGVYLEVLGRHEEAEALLERAVRQRPGDPDALLRLGLHYFKAGELEAADPWLERAWLARPERADIARTRAQILDLQARFPEALEVLDRVLAAHPRNPQLVYQRGLIRKRSGDPEGAIADLRWVMEHAPWIRPAGYVLGQALRAAGREVEAEAEMKAYAGLEKEDRRRRTEEMQALQGIGIHAGGDPTDWRRKLEELVRQWPGSAEAYRRLAAAYEREGQVGKAAAAYERAVRFDPEDAVSQRRRGGLLLQMGRAGEALDVLEQARVMDPADPLVQPLLEQARLQVRNNPRTSPRRP